MARPSPNTESPPQGAHIKRKSEIPDQDSEREKRRAWPFLAAALLAVGLVAALVVLDGSDHPTKTLRLAATGQEAGWWTQISVEQRPREPGAPSGPAATLVTASVPSDVLFPEGSAKLDEAARASLRELATHVAMSTGPVVIDGHTDLRGEAAANMQLGRARAEAVASLLAETGVPADRISVNSYGETQPVCEQVNADGSDNADCRARCRRVVITYTVASTPDH